MDATVQKLDLRTVQLQLRGTGPVPRECMGFRISPAHVLTVAFPFESEEPTASRRSIKTRVIPADVPSGSQGPDIPYDATSALLDTTRGVALLPLGQARPLGDDWQKLLAQRDPAAGDSCSIAVFRPTLEIRLKPDATSRPVGVSRLQMRVVGTAEFQGLRCLGLSAEGHGSQPGDAGAPVFAGDRLVGVLLARDAEGAEYMVPASAIRDAMSRLGAEVAMLALEKFSDDEPVPEDAESTASEDQEPDEGHHDSASLPPLDPAAVWTRLSDSSRRAFRHAESIRRRDGKQRVHMEHLLLALYEKREGPTRGELQRAGIGDAELRSRLERIGERKLPRYERSEQLPDLEALPALSGHVTAAVHGALRVAEEHRSEEVQSRHLFFGALTVRHCGMIKWMYERENPIDPARIDMDAPPSGPDAAQIATGKTGNAPPTDSPAVPVAPASPSPPAAQAVAAPGTQSAPTPALIPYGVARVMPDLAEGDDLFGVKREVEAICAVVAAADTDPPLSIGLFGDWGTGKSFFMELMIDRINELRKVARAKESSYCRNIVQLRFNAWHYMDTDLWASLTAEIFEGLGRALEEDEKLREDTPSPDAARLRLLGETSHLRDVVVQAEHRRDEAAAALRASEEEAASLMNQDREIEARLSPMQITRAVTKVVTEQEDVRKSLDRAVARLDIPEAPAAATEIRSALLEMRGVWGSVRAMWLALRQGSGRLWLFSALAVLFVVLVAGVVYDFADRLIAPARLVVSFVVAAAPVVTLLAREAKKVKQVLDSAREQSTEVLKAARKAEADRLEKEQTVVRERLKQEEETVRRTREQLAAAEKSLKALSADHQMMEFIRERQESTEYTRHFGVIARARHDFERLSALLDEVSERKRRRKKATTRKPAVLEAKLGVPRIDRIILYIDDLDRCPEEKVVHVLQAVHLLLAFPLFIVVVGVDSRWLLHSLRRHSTAFRLDADMDGDGMDDDEDVHWQSTPFNYLEKIFQIPFNLRPMEASGFEALVKSLTVSDAEPRVGHTEDPAAVKPAGDAKQAQKERTTPSVGSTAPTVVTSAPADRESSEAGRMAPDPRVPDPPSPQTRGASVPNTPSPDADAQPAAEETAPGDSHAGARGEAPDPTIEPKPRYLEISEVERQFMFKMHRLIPTPRAAKRYVNVYRLMRALLNERERQKMHLEGSGGCRQVLLLTAILTGFPQEGTTILRELLAESKEERWWKFVTALVAEKVAEAERTSARAPSGSGKSQQARGASSSTPLATDDRLRAQRWRDLAVRLGEVKALVGAELGEDCRRADFAAWAPHVARYSFEAGRVVQA